MNDLKKFVLREILPRVEKPARYMGNEWNSVHKYHDDTNVRVLLAFPDVYEVGMSSLGFKILYHVLNERDDALAERAFAPWVDMEREMRARGVPLFGLESYVPAAEYDIIGFSLQYEMSYTNVLNMLNLAGIPLRQRNRGETHPLVIGGGPGAYNPEPLAEFFDFMVVGEGEEVVGEIVDWYGRVKVRGLSREGMLREAGRIEGVYVPSLYGLDNGKAASVGPLQSVRPIVTGVPERIKKRVIKDLNHAPYPEKLIVPFVEVVHDRVMLEVFRGCTRGCRFCQAGMVGRPVRERSVEFLEDLACKVMGQTGYEELSLMSLSTADYSGIDELMGRLVDRYKGRGVSVSLPSLRADSFSVRLARDVGDLRKTGLTFAPEAGTPRLRAVINKGVTDEDLMDAVAAAFEAGWSAVKLYFMVGLPTETQEDLDGIARLAKSVLDRGKTILGRRNRGRAGRVRVAVSLSSFVPKAHTPFQWSGQASIEKLEENHRYLQKKVVGKGLSLSWHDPRVSFLEAALSRGDRRLSRVLERAWELGCKFDSWSEHFRFEDWMLAFREENIDPAFYANRDWSCDSPLPWDHIDAGVTKAFLASEIEKAMMGISTPDCRLGKCVGCGVCIDFDTEPFIVNGGVIEIETGGQDSRETAQR